MPISLQGAFTVGADRPTVWAKLHDPVFLQRCLGECEALRRVDDTRYLGAARIRLGLFDAVFRGSIDLEDVDPPHGWRMVGRGEGGLAGFAKGVASVRLKDVPRGTAVAYTLEASLGGRLTRLRGRIVHAVAQRVADRFFANVAIALLATAEPA